MNEPDDTTISPKNEWWAESEVYRTLAIRLGHKEASAALVEKRISRDLRYMVIGDSLLRPPFWPHACPKEPMKTLYLAEDLRRLWPGVFNRHRAGRPSGGEIIKTEARRLKVAKNFRSQAQFFQAVTAAVESKTGKQPSERTLDKHARPIWQGVHE